METNDIADNNCKEDNICESKAVESDQAGKEFVLLAKQNAQITINNIYSLISVVPNNKNVIRMIDNMIQSEYWRLLRCTPIEEFNNPPMGIRISALRARGFYNMAQLINVSYESLIKTYGIGELSARNIYQQVILYKENTWGKVYINPIYNTEGRMLIHEYYKYRNMCVIYDNSRKKYESTYNELITAFNNIDRIDTQFKWDKLKPTVKEALLKNAVKLNELNTVELTSKVYVDLVKRSRILSADENQAWKDYNIYRQSYCNELNRLKTDIINNKHK